MEICVHMLRQKLTNRLFRVFFSFPETHWYSLYYPEWPIWEVIAYITSYYGRSICEHTNFDSYNSIKRWKVLSPQH